MVRVRLASSDSGSWGLLALSINLLTKTRENGLQESLSLCRDIARTSIARFSRRDGHSSIFLSTPMSNSGAPQVLMQVVDEFAERYGSESIRLLTPRIYPEMRDRVTAGGVRVERAAAIMGPRLVGLQLALRRDDFVLMNTVGVLRNYQTFILNSLRTGSLAHAYWYIHEDIDQLPAVAPFLTRTDFRSLINQLVEQGRLTLLVPSRKVKTQYDELFATDRTRLLPFKMTLENGKVTNRTVDDYASVRFLLSGKPTDGRKGHMIVLAAFHEFLKSFHEQSPGEYRDFTLTLVGMTDDYVAEQIRSIGSTLLGDRLEVVPEIAHEEALEITRTCNAVICCSFNEALPVYVIEGMRMGHIVLRNDAGGMEEQLVEGANGFQIDSRDVRQFAGVLERVLNRRGLTDARLHTMGKASQEMLADLLIPSYVEALALARGADDERETSLRRRIAEERSW